MASCAIAAVPKFTHDLSRKPVSPFRDDTLGCRPHHGRQGMADLPRLNGIIRALETGQHALTCFAPAEINSAIAMSTSKFDGCVFEMEHNPWDGRLLRDCLQY